MALGLVALIAGLFLYFKPRRGIQLGGVPPTDTLPSERRPRILTLGVFVLTVVAWVFEGYLASWLGTASLTAWVAMCAVVLIGLLRLLDWPTIQRSIHWDVLLLFMGGLTLGDVVEQTGLAASLAEPLAHGLQGVPSFWVLLTAVLFTVFVSELLSNTATAALLIPLLLPLAQPLGIQPVALAIPVAIAASTAFMMPVGTPPNAMVYATGLIPQRDMLRLGLWLNLTIGVIVALVCWAVQRL
jgi:sodium-dependent dicarboxylate transporter 2/3/5